MQQQTRQQQQQQQQHLTDRMQGLQLMASERLSNGAQQQQPARLDNGQQLSREQPPTVNSKATLIRSTTVPSNQQQNSKQFEADEGDSLDSSQCDLNTRIRLLQSKLHPVSGRLEDNASGSPMDHGQRSQSQQSGDSSIRNVCCSSSGEHSPVGSSAAPSPANEDEEDSLSISSSSGSSNSSLAPTPPPRFSSLLQSHRQHHQAQQVKPEKPLNSQQQQQQTIHLRGLPALPAKPSERAMGFVQQPQPLRSLSSVAKVGSLTVNLTSSRQQTGLMPANTTNRQQQQQQQQVELCSAIKSSGDNKCVPLVTHATPSSPMLLLASTAKQQQQQHLQNRCPDGSAMPENGKIPIPQRTNKTASVFDSNNFVAPARAYHLMQPQQQQQLSQQQQLLLHLQRNNPTMGSQALLQPSAGPTTGTVNSQSVAAPGGQRTAPIQQNPHHNHHHANQLMMQTRTTLSNLSPPKTSINCLLPGKLNSALHHQQQQAPNNYSPSQPATCYGGQQSVRSTAAGQQQQVQARQSVELAGQAAPKGANGAGCGPLTWDQSGRSQFNQFTGPHSRAPITKAVQEMVNQQQATLVINTPASRQPIGGSTISINQQQQQNPIRHLEAPIASWSPKNLGLISSAASMSSLSSAASSSCTSHQHAQQYHNQLQQHQEPQFCQANGLPSLTQSISCGQMARQKSPQAKTIKQISSDSVQLLVSASQQLQLQASQKQKVASEEDAEEKSRTNELLMMQEPHGQQAQRRGQQQQQELSQKKVAPLGSPVKTSEEVEEANNDCNKSPNESRVLTNDNNSEVPSRMKPFQLAQGCMLDESSLCSPASIDGGGLDRRRFAYEHHDHGRQLWSPPKKSIDRLSGVDQQQQRATGGGHQLSVEQLSDRRIEGNESSDVDYGARLEMVSSLSSSPQQVGPAISCSPSALSPASTDPNRWLQQQQQQQLQSAAEDSQQRQQQRQTELLQLMRLRHQQQLAAAALNSASNSQELPTLQQLQQQIQQQRSSSAAPARLQAQQIPKKQLQQAPEQQQRMQQWTAATAASAMLQQQQQQQRQQENPATATAPVVTQPSRPGNDPATASDSSSTTSSARLLQMTEGQIVQANGSKCILNSSPTTTTLNNYHHSARFVNSQATNYNIGQSPAIEGGGQMVVVENGPHCEPEHLVKYQHTRPMETLLTTADHTRLKLHQLDADPQTAASYRHRPKEPIARPRASQSPAELATDLLASEDQHQSVNSIQDELSILTNTGCVMNPRVRDLTEAGHSLISVSSSAQSTPPHSILSDSTTLITEAAMNSADMIPKLIERLDGKLIVMKEAQLSLMRDIELNEATGQRLFDSMRRNLTDNEFEKITLHVNEIEKVTKLILSLKLRLKRVEGELKERTANSERHIARQQPNSRATDGPTSPSSCVMASPDIVGPADHQTREEEEPHSNSTSQQLIVSSSSSSLGRPSDHTTTATTTSPLKSNSQQASVRGVSDPTSTTGLPKRNHQHHASLQLAAESRPADQQHHHHLACGRLLAREQDHQLGATGASQASERSHQHHQHEYSLTSSSCDSRSSPVCSPRGPFSGRRHPLVLEESTGNVTEPDDANAAGGAKKASASSDSIFNCSDSAIGSTITGHGGSSTNIEQPTISQSSLTSSSSSSGSASSSLVSSASSRHHHHSKSPSQSHLSSDISVSSHSSMSSVPNSPPLVSPAGTANSGRGTLSSLSSVSIGQQQQLIGASYLKKQASSTLSPNGAQSNTNTSLNSSGLSAPFKSDGDNNNNISANSADNPSDSMLHLLTDIDILIAKRNKLISQLEEAHQLEECIIHRNNIIIQRILKKYYEDMGGQDGEIAEFKQFTHLKSLLLRDTHDVADRIKNAELQLTELRQTNQCNA